MIKRDLLQKLCLVTNKQLHFFYFNIFCGKRLYCITKVYLYLPGKFKGIISLYTVTVPVSFLKFTSTPGILSRKSTNPM